MPLELEQLKNLNPKINKNIEFRSILNDRPKTALLKQSFSTIMSTTNKVEKSITLNKINPIIADSIIFRPKNYDELPERFDHYNTDIKDKAR